MSSYKNLFFLYIGLFACSVFIVIYVTFIYLTNTTRIIFCDVGQGDGVYIRTSDSQDILIDAGPDEKMSECLQKYMPFFDHHIEAVFVSHFQKDHYGGLKYIRDRYSFGTFFVTQPLEYSQDFLQKTVKIHYSKIQLIDETSNIYINKETFFKVFWPKKAFIEAKDMNFFSHIMLFEDNGFSVLFTGDAIPEVLSEVDEKIRNYLDENGFTLEILKVPHHGSENGLTENFLSMIQPTIAIISSGKHNSYGHPSKKVIKMLQSYSVSIYNTADFHNIQATVKDHHVSLDFLHQTRLYEVY